MMVPYQVLEVSMIARDEEVGEDGLDMYGNEPYELTLKDAELLSASIGETKAQKQYAEKDLTELRRVFAVKAEFQELEDDVKQAVLGDLSFQVIKRNCSDGVQRRVTVERSSKDRDQCRVRYFRDMQREGLTTRRKDCAEKGYRVTVGVFVNRLVLQNRPRRAG